MDPLQSETAQRRPLSGCFDAKFVGIFSHAADCLFQVDQDNLRLAMKGCTFKGDISLKLLLISNKKKKKKKKGVGGGGGEGGGRGGVQKRTQEFSKVVYLLKIGRGWEVYRNVHRNFQKLPIC